MRTRHAAITLLLLVFAAPLWGQILVPPTVEPYQPVVATLTAELPEGAQIQGGWGTDDPATCSWLATNQTTIHVWARPGRHVLTFRGAWLATRSVELPSGEVIQAVTGFGFLDHAAEFTVGTEPEPEPDPDPPIPPPGDRWGLIVEETAQRTPAQASLWNQIRQQLQSKLLIVDKDQSSSKLSKAVQAAREADLPLPVLVVLATDAGASEIVRVVPVPGTVAAIKEELAK